MRRSEVRKNPIQSVMDRVHHWLLPNEVTTLQSGHSPSVVRSDYHGFSRLAIVKLNVIISRRECVSPGSRRLPGDTR
jgi:hypothetical protein